MADALPTHLQENILTLMCWSDEAAPVLCGLIEPALFDNDIYRLIADRARRYVAEYRRAPRAHVTDLFAADLEGKSARAKALKGVLREMKRLADAGINEEYVLRSVRDFLRQQRIKAGVIRAAQLLQEGRVEEAEREVLASVRAQDKAIDTGLTLGDVRAVVRRRLAEEDDGYLTGIKALDGLGLRLGRKTLTVVMAPTNRGKSWWLVHIGKFAVLQRARVAHVTLELSEREVLCRYAQALLSLTRDAASGSRKVRLPSFERDESGMMVGIGMRRRKRPSLYSDRGLRMLERKMKSARYLFGKLRLVVKEFPTSSLTMGELEAYLGHLDALGYMPDMLIVDYADLMRVNVSNMRLELGRLYQELRGLAVRHNMAVVTATQANREGMKARHVSSAHVAEDISKVFTADLVLTYSQTEEEERLGIARVIVEKARTVRRGDVAVIAQCYDIGQFCLDSSLLPPKDVYSDALLGGGEE